MNAAQAKLKATLAKKTQAKEAENQAVTRQVRLEADVKVQAVSMEKALRAKIEEAAGEGKECAFDWWYDNETMDAAYSIMMPRLVEDGFRVSCKTKHYHDGDSGHSFTFGVTIEWGEEKEERRKEKEERRDDYRHGF